MNAAGPYRTLGLCIALVVLIFDQIIKYIVSVPLALKSRGVIELIPIFRLTWMENRGTAMGLFTAGSETARWGLVAMTTVIAVIVGVWLWREKARDDVLALGLILGGAIGNIADRSRLGYVIDYADLHFGGWQPFLIFNLADASITIGVLILLARALLLREKAPKPESS